MDDYIMAMRHAPALVEWWKLSACHQGATLAFALALVHHPDIKIPEIAAGFPAGVAAVSEEDVNHILEMVAPFSGLVECCVDMEDYMPTVLTPEEEVNPPFLRDFESKTPFADIAAGRLFIAPPAPAEGDQDQEASSVAPPS
jgi:hypothetical protein